MIISTERIYLFKHFVYCWNTPTIQKWHLNAVRPLGKSGWGCRCQENFYHSSPAWLEKASRTSSRLLSDHNEEQPVIAQPFTFVWKMPPNWHWTDHFRGYWQQGSYGLKWCKVNNDDDDDVSYSDIGWDGDWYVLCGCSGKSTNDDAQGRHPNTQTSTENHQ